MKVACSPSFSSIDSRFVYLFFPCPSKKRKKKRESIEEKDGLQATFMLFFGGWGGGLLRILVREKGWKASKMKKSVPVDGKKSIPIK